MKKLLSLLLAALLLFPAGIAAADSKSPSRNIGDYAGRGTVIALIGSGFYTEHPALAEAPDDPYLYQAVVDETLPGAFLSDKIAAAWDFSGDDADVNHTSYIGTAAATLAAGMFTGSGDTVHEDGSVTHESSYYGAAPHAQLLLFKAAPDTSVKLQPAAAAEALEAALALGADAVWLDTDGLTLTADLRSALLRLEKAGIPILTGTGEITKERPASIPVTYTDRGTLADHAAWPGITLIGAAADPYAAITSFLLTAPGAKDVSVSYSDSCTDYFGEPFAALFGGQSLPVVAVPGVGAPEDYQNISVTGAVAVIMRGEITFGEKAKNAADAGAVAMIVVDNGTGLSRMALEDAPIPGVMVEKAVGETILAAKDASISFAAGDFSLADFSASGISDDLSAAPAFLCAGQRVKAGIPPSQLTTNAYYANVSGTRFAAASAVGYTARAVEYLRARGADTAGALAAAASSARPLTDEDGNPLPMRDIGCGLVSDKGEYASVSVTGKNGSPISLCGSVEYASASLSLTLTNHTDTRRSCSISLSAEYEAYAADENGSATLTGAFLPIKGIRAYAGDSSTNICGGEKTAVYSLAPGMSITVPLRIVIPDAAVADILKVCYNGFFIDGTVTVTDPDGTSVAHPYSVFCGPWEAAPLADVTVYEDADPLFKACRLAVRRFGQGTEGVALPLGAVNPYASDSPISESANLVNPALLKLGWVELELCALRNIDEISVVFYDSEHRTVLTRELGSADKYTKDGTVTLPLWDFAAVDNPDYLFPDGEYACEIRLSSNFGRGRDAVQFLGFFITLDSEKPQVSEISARREGDQLLLTLRAEDNRALFDVSVYDTVYTFSSLEGAGTSFAGQKQAVMTFDITQFDGHSPIYLEITDRAENYRTVRITPHELEAMLAQPQN